MEGRGNVRSGRGLGGGLGCGRPGPPEGKLHAPKEAGPSRFPDGHGQWCRSAPRAGSRCSPTSNVELAHWQLRVKGRRESVRAWLSLAVASAPAPRQPAARTTRCPPHAGPTVRARRRERGLRVAPWRQRGAAAVLWDSRPPTSQRRRAAGPGDAAASISNSLCARAGPTCPMRQRTAREHPAALWRRAPSLPSRSNIRRPQGIGA